MSLLTARDDGMTAAEALLKALDALRSRLSPRIAAIMGAIATTAGRIDATAENIALVDALVEQMRAEFVDEQLADDIIAYIDSLDGIAADVIEALSDLGDIDQEVVDAIDQRYRVGVAAYLTDSNTYAQSLWRPVANSIILGVVTNSMLNDTIASVSEVVETAPLSSATATVVESAPMELQRTATAAVAEQVGAQFFLYQGRPLKTTRVFCEQREGRYWHREEIAQWGRDAAAGVDLDGSGNPGWEGMVEGTNEQTIFIHLGGWYGGRNSCRHVLIPVPRFRVPEEDLARMKAAGLVV